MPRAFASRVAVESPSGDTLRHVPADFARALVNSGSAAIANANGKVKSVRLVSTASTHAQRIGAPGEWSFGVRFSVREKLDSGGVTWKHHARATYEEP